MFASLILAVVLIWVRKKLSSSTGLLRQLGEFLRISRIVMKARITYRNHPGTRTILWTNHLLKPSFFGMPICLEWPPHAMMLLPELEVRSFRRLFCWALSSFGA
ncbi:hypothetical protein EDD85DRAFT_829553 [Armillaria nabsnona]|nr:hypothetical protein EDD85DRAFT_829553 [Armillaria nabsnona]